MTVHQRITLVSKGILGTDIQKEIQQNKWFYCITCPSSVTLQPPPQKIIKVQNEFKVVD